MRPWVLTQVEFAFRSGYVRLTTHYGPPAPLPHARPRRHAHLLLDPAIRERQPVFQTDLRLPAQHFAQPGIVGVAAADALRTGHVLLRDAHARDLRHHVGELV